MAKPTTTRQGGRPPALPADGWRISEIVASWISAAATTLALFGVALAYCQLRQARIAEEQQTYVRIAEAWNSHLQLFIEHQDLRPYFFDGTPLAASAEPDKVLAMADVRLAAIEQVLLSADRKRWEEAQRQAWDQVFLDAFAMSPVLCTEVRQAQAHYDPAIKALAREGCARVPPLHRNRPRPRGLDAAAIGLPL